MGLTAMVACAETAFAQEIVDLYLCRPQPVIQLAFDPMSGDWERTRIWTTEFYVISRIGRYDYVVRGKNIDRSGLWCQGDGRREIDDVYYCYDFIFDTSTMRFSRQQIPGLQPAHPSYYRPHAQLELGFCEPIPPGTPPADFGQPE
ncbi:MAG: hypothetical protein KIS96_10965 [Bauldia sp.]|nr:hypothetical protein [Bauldia sp.]